MTRSGCRALHLSGERDSTDLLTQDNVSIALLLEIDNLEDMMWINKTKQKPLPLSQSPVVAVMQRLSPGLEGFIDSIRKQGNQTKLGRFSFGLVSRRPEKSNLASLFLKAAIPD